MEVSSALRKNFECLIYRKDEMNPMYDGRICMLI